MTDVERTQGRWYAKSSDFNDVLKEGKGTEFVIESIRFDADIPDYIKSKAALRR